MALALFDRQFMEVSLFVVLSPAREYFAHMHTSPLPVKDCKI